MSDFDGLGARITHKRHTRSTETLDDVEAERIGRFAVWFNEDTELWQVDHIPTGYRVLDFDTEDEAMQVAKDLDYWSPHDPSSTVEAEVKEQIGEDLVKWLKAMKDEEDDAFAIEGYEVWHLKKYASHPRMPAARGFEFDGLGDALVFGDLAEVATHMEDADFWLQRRGTKENVGQPNRDGNPEDIGIYIMRTDRLLPDYAYFWFQKLWMDGYWRYHSQGSLPNQHIRVSDVKNIPMGGI